MKTIKKHFSENQRSIQNRITDNKNFHFFNSFFFNSVQILERKAKETKLLRKLTFTSDKQEYTAQILAFKISTESR